MRMKKRKPKIKTLSRDTNRMTAILVSKTMSIACFLKREMHWSKLQEIGQTQEPEEVVSIVEESHFVTKAAL